VDWQKKRNKVTKAQGYAKAIILTIYTL